jgi:lipase chaperone LimK
MVVLLRDEASEPATAPVSTRRTPWLIVLGLVLVALGWAVVAWTGDSHRQMQRGHGPSDFSQGVATSGPGHASAQPLVPSAGPLPLAGLAPPEGEASQAFARWLQSSSSLRGTELDGSWGELDAQGRLQPSLALRRRLDQLLTLMGERPLEDIAAYVAAQASQALGPGGGQQVQAIWQRYVALQQEPLRTTVVLSDRRTWPAAQAERQAQRLRHLGPQWTKAFFEAEEQAFTALMQNPPAAGAPPLIDPATLTPQQRERWLQAQGETLRWQQRLEAARSHWQGLARQPQLSDVQRHAQMQAYLQGAFDAQEQRRVRALLNLPM